MLIAGLCKNAACEKIHLNLLAQAEVKIVWLLILNNSKGCDQKSADCARPH